MVTGLYAALAASASVFIGILTALLASDLSQLKSEQERIDRRRGAIDGQIQSLDNKKDEIESQVEDVEESQTLKEIRSRWKNYDRVPHSGPTPRPPEPIRRTDFSNEEKQEVEEWQRHKRELLIQLRQEWRDTRTEVESLWKERQDLEDRYESLDTSQIRASLRATIVTICLSVGIPLLAYLFRVTGITLMSLPAWVEPMSIFTTWAIGLGYVFTHLRDQLGGETDEFPEEPELNRSEGTVEKEAPPSTQARS